MTLTFDLLREPWIPCIPKGGNSSTIYLGIRDTLVRAHELHALHAQSPLTTVALMRLLLAITHRVFGPRDIPSWTALWQTGHWDAAQLDDYFGWRGCAGRFDLFDDKRPFYQVTQFRANRLPDPRPVSELVHEEASGNNVTLFDHHFDDQQRWIAPGEAARRLITAQAYTLGFGISHVYQDRQCQFADGPCARGALFLIEGDSLFETLLLNMRQYPLPNSRLPDRSDDAPAWEMEDPLADGRELPLGYLDYLTWQTWQIQLIADETSEGPRVTRVRRCMGL
ncbi:MAG: type I-E CRISPR-associated protein Cse1/CasA, partial [Anaerolineales bacterium]